jgi:fumarate reductase subunit D
MRNTSNRVTQALRTWLEKAGYVLAGVGIVLLLLVGVVLPFTLFGGQHHYYRVAPAENGWIMAAALTALGALLVVIGRALRTTNR